MKSDQALKGAKSRLDRVTGSLLKEKLDACLIESPVDLYYLTGLSLSTGKLFLHPQESRLFVDGRYLQVAHERAPLPVELGSKEAVSAFLSQVKAKKVGFDGGRTSYDQLCRLKDYSEIEWTAAGSFFNKLRLIKDQLEIELMERSAALAWKGYEWILSALKVGVTERQISKGFEIFCLEQGAVQVVCARL
ncbi:MAG: aminopeptidase P family N-terminal domain-containing protein [Chlamydiota bacterium]